jgi:sugar-specific transcriptional regulator TrmB
MYQEILKKLGLNANEAHIYELLLTKGRTKARDLLTDSGLGRGNLYNVLTSLVSQGLATVAEGKQQIYEAAEPSHLAILVDDQKRRADRLAQEFQGELPKLLSTFNLTTGKPAIQVFEGIEGVEIALMESLSAKSSIYTYLDPSAFSEDVAKLNARYIALRQRKGITKRIILPDNEGSRQYVANATKELTEYLLIPGLPAMPEIAVEMYGDTVTYLNLRGGKTISVIVRDISIASMHLAQFEFLWKTFKVS